MKKRGMKDESKNKKGCNLDNSCRYGHWDYCNDCWIYNFEIEVVFFFGIFFHGKNYYYILVLTENTNIGDRYEKEVITLFSDFVYYISKWSACLLF